MEPAASEHEIECPARAVALLVHSVPGVRNRARLPGAVARATRRICERKLLRMLQGSATVSSLGEQSWREGARRAGGRTGLGAGPGGAGWGRRYRRVARRSLYLFGSLFFLRPIAYHNVDSFAAKPLHDPLEAVLFACMEMGGRKETIAGRARKWWDSGGGSYAGKEIIARRSRLATPSELSTTISRTGSGQLQPPR